MEGCLFLDRTDRADEDEMMWDVVRACAGCNPGTGHGLFTCMWQRQLPFLSAGRVLCGAGLCYGTPSAVCLADLSGFRSSVVRRASRVRPVSANSMTPYFIYSGLRADGVSVYVLC